MKILNQTIMMLAICGLAVVTGRAQDWAAFKVPDSPRPFLFNIKPLAGAVATSHSNNAARGVEGLWTVQAKRFKTAQDSRGGTISFYDAIVCRAQRIEAQDSHSSVMIVGEIILRYPADTSVLVFGRSMRLADLSEKTFDAPTPIQTYTGKDAIRKLKEMGLELPEDMDPASKDRVRK